MNAIEVTLVIHLAEVGRRALSSGLANADMTNDKMKRGIRALTKGAIIDRASTHRVDSSEYAVWDCVLPASLGEGGSLLI